MPAILFEASFLSNSDDERRLRTPHFQQTTANAIVDAVETWLGAPIWAVGDGDLPLRDS